MSRATFSTRYWRPAVQRSGIQFPARMHDLRHAHASWLPAGGADLLSVMERMGHAQIETTQNYLHTSTTPTNAPSPRSTPSAPARRTETDGTRCGAGWHSTYGTRSREAPRSHARRPARQGGRTTLRSERPLPGSQPTRRSRRASPRVPRTSLRPSVPESRRRPRRGGRRHPVDRRRRPSPRVQHRL